MDNQSKNCNRRPDFRPCVERSCPYCDDQGRYRSQEADVEGSETQPKNQILPHCVNGVLVRRVLILVRVAPALPDNQRKDDQRDAGRTMPSSTLRPQLAATMPAIMTGIRGQTIQSTMIP